VLLVCAGYAFFLFNRGHDLVGQIVWVDDPRAESLEDARLLDEVSGTAYLLLEENYALAHYPGPPNEDVTKRGDYFTTRFKFLPDDWRLAKQEPTGSEPEYLLAAPLDSAGRFRFKDLPAGRHTLFIRWGNNPVSSDCISGPYEVVLGDRRTSEERFLVSRFDLISS
jgi:hypothetical protein